MPSITITERDQTAGNPVLSASDIVYVPGLVTNTAGKFNADTVLEQFVPTLITNIAEFEAACGTEPYLFAAAQNYPVNFASVSIPDSQIMFATGDPDPAYIYARELVNLGIPVVYERLNDKISVASVGTVYDALAGDIWDKLVDKVEYQFKYLTSGGYPTFEYGADADTPGNIIAAKMYTLAETRGDCLALIDHTNNPERSMTASAPSSVYYSISNVSSAYRITNEYATLYTPWCSYTEPSAGYAVDMPGSFAYLTALAKSLKNGNDNWLSIAGVKRGNVPNLVLPKTYTPLTKSIADSYQPKEGVCINAIANIKPYGYTIWGNRTLFPVGLEGTVAKNFVNTRNTLSDIKKIVYSSALRYMFEPNSEVLKLNFSSAISPTLNKMVTGNGLVDWSIRYLETTDKVKLSAVITVVPVYAVEDFDISVVISNDGVEVE